MSNSKKNELLNAAAKLGSRIPFSSIEDREDIDHRIAIANCYNSFIIGMNTGFIEFCPNNTPPSEEELLSLLWVVKPKLSSDIVLHIRNQDLSNAMKS